MTSPSDSDLYKFLQGARTSRHLVIDTEGDGKDVRDRSAEPVTMGVTLAYRDSFRLKHSYYFAFQHLMGENQPKFFEPVRDIIRTHPCLIMHNAKHDLIALELWDIYRFHGFYDTMIMAHLINENHQSYSLDYLSRRYGGEPKGMTDLMKRIIDFLGWDHIPVDMMREYSNQDGFITLELFEKLYPEFCAQGLDGEYWHKEEQWIWTISQMEKCGIRINNDLCEREISKATKILNNLKQNLDGMNPLSATDLYELLINKLKLPVVKWTDGGKKGKPKPSFNKDAMRIYEPMLDKMGSPVANHIIRYRGWTKVKSTNYEPYLRLQGKDGRLRPNYNLHRAVTRRLTCGSDSDGKTEVNSPNLQNIPRVSQKEWDGKLKLAFIAEDGYDLWDFDYGQIELRIAAAYSKDEKLLEIFKSGKHIFRGMAEDLGWEYHNVKTFVYATSYNAGNGRIAGSFNISIEEAAEMRGQFNTTYIKLVEFKERVSKRAERQMYTKYWTGARRHYRTKKEASHLAFNSLIQGGAAEVLKYAAIRIAREIDWDTCKMLLQVHDSLVFEIKHGYESKWIPLIKSIMEDVPEPLGSRVPFVAEVKKWGTEEKWQTAA